MFQGDRCCLPITQAQLFSSPSEYTARSLETRSFLASSLIATDLQFPCEPPTQLLS